MHRRRKSTLQPVSIRRPEMNRTSTTGASRTQYELRFPSLFREGRGYVFPCDAAGCVDMDSLGERARNDYLFARAVIGRELSTPRVLPCAVH
jgi:hypothetical protein